MMAESETFHLFFETVFPIFLHKEDIIQQQTSVALRLAGRAGPKQRLCIEEHCDLFCT